VAWQITLHTAVAGISCLETDETRCATALISKQESLALASMARDDPPASSTASSTAPASSTAAAMRGKVGSEFET